MGLSKRHLDFNEFTQEFDVSLLSKGLKKVFQRPALLL